MFASYCPGYRSARSFARIVGMVKVRVGDKKRLKQLRELVAFHRAKYYTEEQPEISDGAYDALAIELAELELALEGALSKVSTAIGGETFQAFEKVRHQVAQWSFDNVFDLAELTAWDEKLKRHLGKQGLEVDEVEYVAEHKIDGLKLVVEYRKGILYRAATRGDGEVGEDVTHTARTIKTLPEKLSHPVDLLCVGEVWMGSKEFEVLNIKELAKGSSPFANPRNAAAGSLRQLDASVAKDRDLSLFAYDIDLFSDSSGKLSTPATQFQELQLLKDLGLPTNPYSRKCKNVKEVEKYYQEWKGKSESLPYGVDGVVIKADLVSIQETAGYTAKSPRFGIAYKFPAIETTTVIEAIDLQVGRTGVVTPVAHLRPVLVDGSTVARATLHNEDQIKRLDVRVGDTIILRKAGDVIPEVVSVVKELRPEKSVAYRFPTYVAACGGDGRIERIPGTSAFRCLSLDSDFLRRQKMYYFVSKNALNMDGVGPKIIDVLLDKELISDVADLFTLAEEEILNLPGFKAKAAQNVIESIDKSSEVSLARLLIGLSIEHVGEETARLLARNFSTVYDVQKASVEELVQIDGVGQVVAEKIIEWQKDNKSQTLLEKLVPHLTITADSASSSEGKLDGQSFVFTGTLEHIARSDAQELVRSLGGVISSSVSKKTNYVVVGTDPGSKAKDAVKLGVNIISESEFMSLIA